MRHTVIVSDVHLGVGVGGDSPWMRWRHRDLFPDDEFSSLCDHLLAEAGGEAIELVFNGDLFEFDLAPVEDPEASPGDPPRTEAYAVGHLRRILDDHPVYVGAIGRMLAAGARVVFLSGNHDPQLRFPRVRELLARRLAEVAGDPASASRVLFRTWFHQNPDGIHVEHGNQYDPLTAYRYPMHPERTDAAEIQPTMGSLTFRHLIVHMGYFNPYVDRSFLMTLPGYLTHWARHYAFSRRSLGFKWAKGALHVMKHLATHRDPGSAARRERNLLEAVAETGVRRAALEAHLALSAPPAEDALVGSVRELWLDRALLAALSLAGLAAPLFLRPGLAVPIAMMMPALFGAWELSVPKRPMEDVYAHLDRTAREIARIHGVRAVVFGHTHQPSGRWEEGVFLGNSGTWAPAFLDTGCRVPADPGGRPVIWLRSEGPRLEGGLHRWQRGFLRPDPGARELPEALGEPGLLPAVG